MAAINKNLVKWEQVLYLRLRGLGYREIGAEVGISHQRVHQIINQARDYAETHDDHAARRLGALVKALYGEAHA